MKPEFKSRRLFGITRSKGKMYELGLSESMHIEVPKGSEPQELFLLAIGTLGDVSAYLNDAETIGDSLPNAMQVELGFAASFFDAFLESHFDRNIDREVTILAASAYYLIGRPGSSLVLARKIMDQSDESAIEGLLHWSLKAQWLEFPRKNDAYFGDMLGDIAELLASHFRDGSGVSELTAAVEALRSKAYRGSSARDLLFADLLSSIVRLRLESSTWVTLPKFTGIASKEWASAIQVPDFPTELWPAQLKIGRSGVFSGASAVIQMPTSAGKTRSVEILLRSCFLSGRSQFAVVVAPFRALCHEIGSSLKYAFRNHDINVNELSDVLQYDFNKQVAEWLGDEFVSRPTPSVLVLTPEKLLYVLRQTPNLISIIGTVVYDEGHQFDSGSRGVTYELLLTQIKGMLSHDAQIVLVSAVIQNAQAIGDWLIGEGANVVSGGELLSTSRSVAFASWTERLGQLMFFESKDFRKPDYFVPRVIESEELGKRGRERVVRTFPSDGKPNDIALYLGLRLVGHGSVAVFCGRKDTASGIAARAVEVFDRGCSLPTPDTFSDINEIEKLRNLMDEHYGNQSILSLAASLGIFVHHGATPQGIRLAIEHAMQKGLVKFVICTSTLAQGVNLPIRYLIVTGIYQAGEQIKVRDFQNLVGRAGRSGIHTEGLVIFSDSTVFDTRAKNSWKFDSSVKLLSPEQSEDTLSSLLAILDPMVMGDLSSRIPVGRLYAILSDSPGWIRLAKGIINKYPGHELKESEIISEFRRRRQLLTSIESYLMANRGLGTLDVFIHDAEVLAAGTLAYHLADEQKKTELVKLFALVAKYVHDIEPSPEKLMIYAKTLLGAKMAQSIESWVNAHRDALLTVDSNEGWLNVIWNLFSGHSEDRFFHSIEPNDLSFKMTKFWISGSTYKDIFDLSKSEKGSKPYGSNRRALKDEDIVSFFENVMGFECSLILAGVMQFLFGEDGADDDEAESLLVFQKSLKYGLPDALNISCFEHGFSDRVIAQKLCQTVRNEGFSGAHFSESFDEHEASIREELKRFPSYFELVIP